MVNRSELDNGKIGGYFQAGGFHRPRWLRMSCTSAAKSDSGTGAVEDQRKKMGEPPLVLKPKKQEKAKENAVLKQALKDTTPKPRSRLRKPKSRNKVAQARAASGALTA
jgi:hypothetical protein